MKEGRVEMFPNSSLSIITNCLQIKSNEMVKTLTGKGYDTAISCLNAQKKQQPMVEGREFLLYLGVTMVWLKRNWKMNRYIPWNGWVTSVAAERAIISWEV